MTIKAVTLAVTTPESDRLAEARVDSQPVGEFLNWIYAQGFLLCRADDCRPQGIDHRTIEQLLADWKGIDLAEVERERMAVIVQLREQAESARTIAVGSEAGRNSQPPTVGMHATEQFYSDQVPYEVIAVPNEKTVIVRALTATRTDKHGMSDVQSYEYTSNPEGETKTFTRRKCGKWIVRGVDVKQAGTRLVLGQARRFHNYSF